jgi:hypothetical protein
MSPLFFRWLGLIESRTRLADERRMRDLEADDDDDDDEEEEYEEEGIERNV